MLQFSVEKMRAQSLAHSVIMELENACQTNVAHPDGRTTNTARSSSKHQMQTKQQAAASSAQGAASGRRQAAASNRANGSKQQAALIASSSRRMHWARARVSGVQSKCK